MHRKLIAFLKTHPAFLNFCWKVAKIMLSFIGLFVKTEENTIIFMSFGGRSFDDSPRAIYDEICKRKEFDGWKLTWVFIDPDAFDLPRGNKIKVDTPAFFLGLLKSRVWVSNSGMDRDIGLDPKHVIKVETWHGAPIKKICGEENSNTLGGKKVVYKGKKDARTIRCAQSEYDREIFARIFHAEKDSIILCDLPRNDALVHCNKEDVADIKKRLNIPSEKKVILYAPTYREYLLDANNETYFAPPVDLNKWRGELSEGYVLLIRAHYAVFAALGIKDDDFVKDVSKYPTINDLYMVSDVMISDYSSAFVDYSILKRPMLCFAYDLEEYEAKRGLYVSLKEFLPCRVNTAEDEIIGELISLLNKDRYEAESLKTAAFKMKYAALAGNAAKAVVDRIVEKI